MKKMIFTSLLLLGFFIFNEVSAQKFDSAVGVRFSYGLTGTYKKYINDNGALEAYLGLGYGAGGLTAGAQYQIHKPLEMLEIDNLDWYYGGGAYVGTYSGFGFGSNHLYLGINANIGLDYTFDDYPVNVSVDWMPGFNIITPSSFSRFFGFGGGLAVRYILGE